MKMILKEQFPYSFFITSWWWSCRKGLHICNMETVPSSSWSWFNKKRLCKLFFQDHDHDSMKNIFGNLSIKIIIMMKWNTYIETFPTRSWSWFSEEHIWKHFLCSSLNHDHDLEGTVSIFVLHYIMILILKERFTYTFFITSWS
jgi:hypothetical protein